MKEWSDKEWKAFFAQNVRDPECRDKWFTRRVVNKLPRKRWSAEIWVSLGVTVAVMAICAVLYWEVIRGMMANDCWRCASAWGYYGALIIICALATGQLGSFLYRLYKVS